MTKIGILIFDDAEELDFVGPFEVFTMARQAAQMEGKGRLPFEVKLISETGEPIAAAKGMRVGADKSIDAVEHLDVLVVPGGQGTRREVGNDKLLAFIARIAKDATWVTSVCTGAMLLTAAGPAKGKRVTTHWAYCQQLREREEAAEVMDGVRYVRDGKIVTAAGVAAGIDMALWLVGQLEDPAFARLVQKMMEYDPAPPYAAEV
jgi:transcriptional regulator GlxA family with amidase domain